MKKEYFILRKILDFLFLQFLCIGALNAQTTLVADTFFFTGTTQTFVIPSCANTMTVQAAGAQGGCVNPPLCACDIGYVQGILTPTPGAILYVTVGGAGTGSIGGFNGGGNGGQGLILDGSGGGGATDVRLGGNALFNRIIVAGSCGGGGGGYSGPIGVSSFGGSGGNFWSIPCGINGAGGWGGGGNYNLTIQNNGGCAPGTSTFVGSGGAGAGVMGAGGLSGGGAGSYGQAGGLGIGGNGGGYGALYGGGGGGVNGAGGGGAGYYGGAGGMADSQTVSAASRAGGGGGGSSYADSVLFSSITFSGTGYSSNGMIVIKYFSTKLTSTSVSVCPQSSLNLAASGMSSYTWHPMGTFVGSGASSVIVFPATPTNYTVSGTSSLGCISQTVFAVTIDSPPPITIRSSPGDTLCAGEMVILTALTSGNNYLWMNSANAMTYSVPSVVVYPNVTTTYSISSINANTCLSKNSILLTVNACTSISEMTEEFIGIKIYPNPNAGIFTIWSSSDITLKLINELGEIVEIIELNALVERQVSVTNLPQGIYFMTGSSGESVISQKMIIARY